MTWWVASLQSLRSKVKETSLQGDERLRSCLVRNPLGSMVPAAEYDAWGRPRWEGRPSQGPEVSRNDYPGGYPTDYHVAPPPPPVPPPTDQPGTQWQPCYAPPPHYQYASIAGGRVAMPPYQTSQEVSRRLGQWTREEEAYAEKVAALFKTGRVPNCPEGLTMRALLADLLNCAPMRVSKKFSGERAIGKCSYKRVQEDLSKEEAELKPLEEAFHRSLRGVGHLKMSLAHTSNLVTPVEAQRQPHRLMDQPSNDAKANPMYHHYQDPRMYYNRQRAGRDAWQPPPPGAPPQPPYGVMPTSYPPYSAGYSPAYTSATNGAPASPPRAPPPVPAHPHAPDPHAYHNGVDSRPAKMPRYANGHAPLPAQQPPQVPQDAPAPTADDDVPAASYPLPESKPTTWQPPSFPADDRPANPPIAQPPVLAGALDQPPEHDPTDQPPAVSEGPPAASSSSEEPAAYE